MRRDAEIFYLPTMKKQSISSFEDLYKLVSGTEVSLERKKQKDPVQGIVKLRVHLEKSGRKGKGVTVISGFHHTKKDLEDMARTLKGLCGAGGTVKNETIEVQGDHRDKVALFFKDKGFHVGLVR